jgi:hypothetical protein
VAAQLSHSAKQSKRFPDGTIGAYILTIPECCECPLHALLK